MMDSLKKSYIETSSHDNFIQPKCFKCEEPVDCIVETPCETTFHTKCFNEIKNGMKG